MTRPPPDIFAPKFYGRRKGKPLRSNKLDAYETVLPDVAIAPIENADPAVFFDGAYKKIWLEVGFGDGAHLLHQARSNPDTGMIGCEPFMNGIAALCKGIAEHDIKNIRILPEDARPFLKSLKPESIDRFFLLNSDPWPKKRHHKRRFLQQETLDDIHRLLKPASLFRITTDHPDLAAWSLEKTYFHGGFTWTAQTAADWKTRPADMDETRYQKKGAGAGRPTLFFDFIKKTP